MSRVQCFLLEPVFGEPGSLPNDPYWGQSWVPDRRLILGYSHPVTGEVKQRAHMFGPGAMWRLLWYPKNHFWENETEAPLCVVCPNGCEWIIDSRCSNCGSPNDHVHRCWVRHGEPPNLTVDKNGGATCTAGAGSIQAGDWHGFLTNGILSENR